MSYPLRDLQPGVAEDSTSGLLAELIFPSELDPARQIGLWLFITRKEATRAGYESFEALMDALTHHLPEETRPAPSLHLVMGAVATTDPDRAETLLTVLVVHKNATQLRSALTEVGLDWPLDGGQ